MINKFIEQLLTDPLMLKKGINADGIQGGCFLENTILSHEDFPRYKTDHCSTFSSATSDAGR